MADLRLTRVVLALVLAVLTAGPVVLVTAGPAAAHAALRSTDPADGATLTAEPEQITFEFNENVGNAAVAVTAPGGERPAVTVSTVDRTATARIEATGERGRYTASYRVVSADGHPVEGTITYDVSTGRPVEQQSPAKAATNESEPGFVHRHRTHIFWGVLAAAVAIGLLLVPLKDRRSDTA